MLEIINSSVATLTWFTYDDDGRQRWLVAGGNVVSDADGVWLEFPELYETSGGVFGDEFDPTQVERHLVGSAQLAFSTCADGQFSFQAYGQAGTFDMQRIGSTMGLACAPVHGLVDDKLAEYAAESGSWFDPSHNGEGFQLQWITSDQALLTWYSYDSEGRQFWMTGVGVRESSNLVSFPSLTATRGARFGAAFDSDEVERFDWGSLTLELGCNSGTATYSSELSGFPAGEQALQRLTALLGVPCPWTKPKLTDLYEFEVEVIDTVLPSDGLPQSIQVPSIADDGTLIGGFPQEDGFNLLRLEPGAAEWESLAGHSLGSSVFEVSPDAQLMLVNDAVRPEASYGPFFVGADGAQERLGGLNLDKSVATAGSHHFTHVVGVGRPFGVSAQTPWIWSRDTGQVELPETDETPSARPLAVGDSGDVVIGTSLTQDQEGQWVHAGIRWEGLAEPEYLFDAEEALLGPAMVCDLNCEVIFGMGQAGNYPDHPHRNQAWARHGSGEIFYLGHVEGGSIDSVFSPYAPNSATSDGSMLVGSLATVSPEGELGSDSFMWTRLTGMVPLREVAIARNGDLSRWDDMDAVDVTSDGSRILL